VHALFAPLLLALLGIAALAVDLGMVTATQARMQVAADVAAVEGLRWQHASAALSESERRQHAREPVAWLLRGVPMGAGAIDDQHEPWLPAPNAANDAAGDLVAGQAYVGDPTGASVDAAEGLWVRPAAGAESPRDAFPAFEARLRRVTAAEPSGTTVPGVRNVAPPVPTFFLVGPHSAVRVSDPASARGWPVRARAVAQGRPALVVGNRIPGTGLPGLADVAVTRAAWSALGAAGGSAIVEVAPAGELLQAGAPFGWRIGTRDERGAEGLAVGDLIPRATGAALQGAPPDDPDIVPVYDAESDHVLGFGWASLEETPPAAPGGARRWLVTKRASALAERNASASFARPGGLAGAQPGTLQQIAAFARGDGDAEPVLAPALAW